jgi:hypothetical protein
MWQGIFAAHINAYCGVTGKNCTEYVYHASLSFIRTPDWDKRVLLFSMGESVLICRMNKSRNVLGILEKIQNPNNIVVGCACKIIL